MVINSKLQFAHQTNKFPDLQLFSFWSLFLKFISSVFMISAETGS